MSKLHLWQAPHIQAILYNNFNIFVKSPSDAVVKSRRVPLYKSCHPKSAQAKPLKFPHFTLED